MLRFSWKFGCGGTILKLIKSAPEIDFLWFVASADTMRRMEAQRSAGEFLRNAKRAKLRIGGFQESCFPDQWRAIKEAIEDLKSHFDPDLIFTHFRDDRYQDHKTLSDLTWNTFRNHLILEFKVPKCDGDLGQPNVFVPLDTEICRAKTEAIMRHFASHETKHWFTGSTFESISRLRGIECASGFAEAFYCRKMIF